MQAPAWGAVSLQSYVRGMIPSCTQVSARLPRPSTPPLDLQASLPPRLPTWQAGEPLLERVLRAMWHFVSTYRLATEEQLDETPGESGGSGASSDCSLGSRCQTESAHSSPMLREAFGGWRNDRLDAAHSSLAASTGGAPVLLLWRNVRPRRTPSEHGDFSGLYLLSGIHPSIFAETVQRRALDQRCFRIVGEMLSFVYLECRSVACRSRSSVGSCSCFETCQATISHCGNAVLVGNEKQLPARPSR
jgi:hypothetical protein